MYYLLLVVEEPLPNLWIISSGVSMFSLLRFLSLLYEFVWMGGGGGAGGGGCGVKLTPTFLKKKLVQVTWNFTVILTLLLISKRIQNSMLSHVSSWWRHNLMKVWEKLIKLQIYWTFDVRVFSRQFLVS